MFRRFLVDFGWISEGLEMDLGRIWKWIWEDSNGFAMDSGGSWDEIGREVGVHPRETGMDLGCGRWDVGIGK